MRSIAFLRSKPLLLSNSFELPIARTTRNPVFNYYIYPQYSISVQKIAFLLPLPPALLLFATALGIILFSVQCDRPQRKHTLHYNCHNRFPILKIFALINAFSPVNFSPTSKNYFFNKLLKIRLFFGSKA